MHEIVLRNPPTASDFSTWIVWHTVVDTVGPWAICTGPSYASSATTRV